MQIIIDTSKDSPEDIRKAIRALQALIGESVSSSANVFSQPAESATNAFGAMFGDNASVSESKQEYEPDEPKIELY